MVSFRRVRQAEVAEPNIHGWAPKPLEWLFGSLAGNHPSIRIVVTGFEQTFSLNGGGYRAELSMRRTDHEFYSKHPLAFEDMPRPESEITFVESESKLVGAITYPASRVEGDFTVASGESLLALQGGQVGAVWLTTTSGVGEASSPLMQFYVNVLNEDEHRRIGGSLRSSLGRGGQSWLNFIVERVTDPSAELEQFKERGYSSQFVITKAYLGVRVGSGHSG